MIHYHMKEWMESGMHGTIYVYLGLYWEEWKLFQRDEKAFYEYMKLLRK